MRHHDEDWLQQKIDEDIIAMADERERELRASADFERFDMSEERQRELRARILEEMALREASKASPVQ